MGLLKQMGEAIVGGAKNVIGTAGSAFVGAAQDTFYREYFESGSMAGNIIMTRGQRIADGKKNGNANANSNIITSGSLVDVQVNQCMIIVENGAIVEFCTEPGRYVFDQSTAPSCFCGNNKGFKPFIDEAKNRFLNGGGRTSTQRIYYINMGKIWEPILWGTGNIPFRNCHKVASHAVPLINNITLRGHGTCEIKVVNPLVFFCEIGAQLTGGDNNGIIRTQDAGIMQTAKTAINSAIARAISAYSNEAEISYTQVGMYLDDIVERMNTQLGSTLGRKGFGVFELLVDGTLQPSEEDVKRLEKSFEEFREAAFYGGNQAQMAEFNLRKSTIRNFEGMGKNEAGAGNVGMNMMGASFGMAAMGMGGMGMGGMGLGMGGTSAYGNPMGSYPQQQYPQQSAAPAPAPAPVASPADDWTCSCGNTNSGKFCCNCGATKPDANNTQTPANTGWTCECGNVNTGRFCSNCGAKKPTVKKYQCDKCGWKPADGKIVRFCPECGDVFNDADIVEE